MFYVKGIFILCILLCIYILCCIWDIWVVWLLLWPGVSCKRDCERNKGNNKETIGLVGDWWLRWLGTKGESIKYLNFFRTIDQVNRAVLFSVYYVLANDGTMVWWHNHSLGGLCQTFRVLQQSFELTDSHWVANFYWTKARRSLLMMVLIVKVGCSWPELMFAFCASLRSMGNLKMWNQSGHNSKSTGLSKNIQTTTVQWRRSSQKPFTVEFNKCMTTLHNTSDLLKHIIMWVTLCICIWCLSLHGGI